MLRRGETLKPDGGDQQDEVYVLVRIPFYGNEHNVNQTLMHFDTAIRHALPSAETRFVYNDRVGDFEVERRGDTGYRVKKLWQRRKPRFTLALRTIFVRNR